jgi:hypothetical protein
VLDPACTDAGVAESVNDGAVGSVDNSLIKDWPLGDPHPVAKSKPGIAANPLLPVVMSWIAAA